MDETVDKEKFRAAVFRRGNKQELFHSSTVNKANEATSLPDQVTGDEKLDELVHLWSLSRSGRDLAAAIWRPSHCAAQVVLQKGRLFSHVGCLLGGHLYVSIEEAVYMVDRGSMLLFHEDPKTRNKSLLTMKECYALMESCGVSMDHFITYCKLLRAGYVAHRRGLPWAIRNKHEAWEQCDFRFGQRLVSQKRKLDVMTRYDVPPAQKKKITAMHHKGLVQKATTWWPEYQWHCEHAKNNIPKCTIYDEKTKEQQRLDMFPRMLPLQTYDQHSVKEGESLTQKDGVYLDVYPPNGSFSRKNPGSSLSIVSMVACGQDYPPSSDMLHEMSSEKDATVRFVGVEHGDIAFYSFIRTTLRNIH